MTEAPEGLTISYKPEGLEGLGELQVSARAKPFAGATVGYVNDSDVLAWTDALLLYPWPQNARPQITSGLGEQETLNLSAFTVTGAASWQSQSTLRPLITTDIHQQRAQSPERDCSS